MKKIYLIFISIISLFLSSCRPLDYGDKYTNVKWTSTYPDIEFTVLENSDDYNVGTINYDDNIINVYCFWSYTSALGIFYKDKIDSLPEGQGTSNEEIAIKGQYKIWRNQGVVKMHVDIDNVFNFKYEYITFVMSEL